jgi:hypothetical protein
MSNDNGFQQPLRSPPPPVLAPPPPDRPVPLPVLFDHIPAVLRGLNAWVVWRYVLRENEWTKPPYQALTGYPASHSDPGTWTTFEAARHAYQQGTWDGVGFVLYEAAGLVGVDLDDARAGPQAPWAPWALELVGRLHSYTEASPSDRGLRCLVYGRLPPHGRRKPQIEMYQERRYVTLTGHTLAQFPASVEARPEQLLALHRDLFPAPPPPAPGQPRTVTDVHDREILDTMFASLHGAKIKRLFEGDWQPLGYDSHSEADCGLLAHLYFWCDGDRERMADLFAQSGLFRPKWRREDYREKTLDRASRGEGKIYDWPRHRANENIGGVIYATTPKPSNGTPAAPAATPAALELPPEYMPFPTVTLPAPVRGYVEQAAVALGCDPVFVALPALAALASAIGNRRVIRLKRNWFEPCVLWAVVVAESGTLKSPAYDLAVDHLRRRQQEFWEKYQEDKANFEKKKQDYKAALEAFDGGKGKGADPGEPPEEPVYRRVVCNDVTIEKLASILEENPAGVLAARDELAAWFGALTCYRQKGESTLPYWLEAHGARSWMIDRKTGPKTHYYVRHAAVSLCGGIQPKVLQKAMTDDFRDAGGQARLLLAMPPGKRKRWTEAEVDLQVQRDYENVLDALLELEFARDHKNGGKVPHTVHLSQEAKALWVDFYDEWAGEQADAQGELAATFSKLEGYAPRLALVHHTVTHAHRGTDTLLAVDFHSMEAAVTLVRWFAREARRIYGLMGQTPQEAQTHELVEFLRRRGDRVTVRQLQNANSRRYRTAAAAEADLQSLVQARLATWTDVPAGAKGGPPSRVCCLLGRPTQPPGGGGGE